MAAQALVLIDIQRGFSDPLWGPRNNPSFEANVARLLQQWRTRAWPIIHVRHDSTMATSPLRPGQAGNTFMDCAAPRASEAVVAKTVHSAFIGTNLQALLTTISCNDLVFAGLTTDHCLSTTVRMAADLGYRATVFADVTATFARRDYAGQLIAADVVHRHALASLAEEFATVVESQFPRQYVPPLPDFQSGARAG